jgi:hypothetical protein
MRVGRTPSGPYQRVVAANERAVTVYRRDETTDIDGTYGGDESGEYAQIGQRDIYLFSEDEQVSVTVAGERRDATLRGLVRDGVDVVEDDRLDYGGSTYEIEQKTPVRDGGGSTLVHQLVLRSV